MADFAPDVPPLNIPNYTRGYSEPIKGVKADLSTGIALSTLGEGIEGAAKLATTTAHDIIDKDVRDTLEPIRAQFTADLQAARSSMIPQGNPSQALGFADTDDSSVPAAVKSGVNNIQSIQDSFVNKKINDTYYHQRLDSAVTALRSKYPGFVDYIDTNTSKITGVNPANALIGDLMQDINRASSNKKTEEDKVLDIARTKGMQFDKGAQMYERLKADPSFAPQFLQWYNQENAKDTALTRDKGELELKGLQGKDRTNGFGRVFSDFVSSKIDSDLNATITLNGVNGPQKIQDIYQKAMNDPSYYTPEQMEEFATKLQMHGNAMKAQLGRLGDQQGFTKEIGPAARDAEIDSQLKWYTSMSEGIRGGGQGGPGAAFFLQNQARAIMDRTRYNLTSGDSNKASNNYQIMSEKMGPALTANILIPSFLKEQKNLPQKLQGLFGENIVEAHAQPGGDENPTTLAGHLSKIASDNRITAAEKGYIYRGLVNTSNDLKDKDRPDDDKAAIARYLFDPNNNGVLQNWKMDYRTTSPDGRLQIVHPGKYQVWNQLTDPDIAANIGKLDEKTKAYYKSWVDITGRSLIGEDVKNLNHFTGHDNLSFKWTNENGTPKLELRDNAGGTTSPVGRSVGVPQYGIPGGPAAQPDQRPITDSYKYQINEVVNRINSALPNLQNVYSKFGGGNVETMLLQTLQQYGLDFNGKITGLPKAFGDAVAASRTPQRKIDDTFDNLNSGTRK